MTTANLNTIAIDVVGHYGQTAKNLLAAYRAGTERAVNALGARYERLVEKQPLPWVNREVKANLVGSQQRVARLVVDSVARVAERASDAVDSVSGRTVQGIEAFDQQTAWAHDMMVVGAIRKVNLPVARLSLRIAGGVDAASKRLSQRVAGTAVAKAPRAAKAAQAVKAGAKRARRAVRQA
ncbi:MAG TPA: hypothetical protein VFZ28_10950 [Burkholderiaceae bacterium]|nr:hypothetical protein [Burkholderiaceae bacterium]